MKTPKKQDRSQPFNFELHLSSRKEEFRLRGIEACSKRNEQTPYTLLC